MKQALNILKAVGIIASGIAYGLLVYFILWYGYEAGWPM